MPTLAEIMFMKVGAIAGGFAAVGGLILAMRTALARWADYNPVKQWIYGLAFSLALLVILWGAIWVYTGVPPWMTGAGLSLAIAMACALVAVVLIQLLVHVVFRPRWLPFAVANAMISEAMATKIVVGGGMLMFLIIAALPFWIDASDPVRYRVQTFLSYSHMVTWVTLSIVTVLLACWTLTHEVDRKQIYTIATKPIGRGSYLLGKWIGLVSLNGVLLTVSGLAIYGFTVFYLAQLTPHSALDAIELNERVLVARVSAAPTPPVAFEEQAAERLQKMIQEEPGTIRQLGEAIAAREGLTVFSDDDLMRFGAAEAQAQLMQTLEKEWMSIGPLQTQQYVFEGLENAAMFGEAVQWRYKVSTSTSVPDDQLKVLFSVNGSRPGLITMPAGTVQEIPIRADLIGPDGKAVLTIRHYNPEVRAAFNATISFRAKEMRMLFQVGTFGPNFFRSMLVVWIKLAFLAMLGLMCASALSFPVASVASLIVFGGAVLSPFVMDALGAFGSRDEGAVAVVKGFLAVVAYIVSMTLSAWGAYRPGPMIVDGLHFGWDQVIGCLIWIGVIWTGLTGLAAWLVFRRRELARVQV